MRRRDLADEMVNKELESHRDGVHDLREKSISYEEAVRREIEYRKLINIRGLPLQPATSSESLPAFPQDSPPNTNLAGMKRKGEPHNFDDEKPLLLSPEQQPPQQPSSSCQLPRHNQSLIVQNSLNRANHLWCNICKVVCMDAFNLKQHLQGKKHKAKCAAAFQNQNIDSSFREIKFLWCQECNVPCMNEVSLAQHRAGKKHAHRLHQLRILKGFPH